MIDGSLHESLIALLASSDDPNFAPPSLYLFNFGQPNQLLHLIGWPIATLLDSLWALRITVALSQVLIVVGVARTAKHFGRPPELALIAIPIALGWYYAWGLATNMLGLGVLFMSLPTFDAFARSPTRRGLAAVGALSAALYAAHELALGMGLCIYSISVLTHVREFRARPLLIRAAPIAVGVALTAWYLVSQERYFAPVLDRARLVVPSLANRLLDAPLHVFGFRQPGFATMLATMYTTSLVMLARTRFGCATKSIATVVGAIGAVVALHFAAKTGAQSPADLEIIASCSYLAVALVLALAAVRGGALARVGEVLRIGRAAPEPIIEGRSRILIPWLVALVAAALYAFAPNVWDSATLLYPRAMGPLLVFVAIALAPAALQAWHRIVLATVGLVTVLVSLPAFVESARAKARLDALLPEIAMGSSVAIVVLDPADDIDHALYPMSSIANRVLAQRGGRTVPSPTASPIAPVVTSPSLRWDATVRRVQIGANGFIPAYDFRLFRFLLVFARGQSDPATLSAALTPFARLRTSSGGLLLFESTSVVAPVDSPQVKDVASGETLRALLDRAGSADTARSHAATLPR